LESRTSRWLSLVTATKTSSWQKTRTISGFHFLLLDTFLVVTQLASFSTHSLADFDVLFTIAHVYSFAGFGSVVRRFVQSPKPDIFAVVCSDGWLSSRRNAVRAAAPVTDDRSHVPPRRPNATTGRSSPSAPRARPS
jgi:hypothetical protein